MKSIYQDLTIHFPFALSYVKDLGMETTNKAHPSFWFEAVIPEEKAEQYVYDITGETSLKVTYENKKKQEERTLFCGLVSKAEGAGSICFMWRLWPIRPRWI